MYLQEMTELSCRSAFVHILFSPYRSHFVEAISIQRKDSQCNKNTVQKS